MSSKKKNNKKPSNELTPWYQVLPSHLKKKVNNPAYSNHKIQLPFRIVCVAYSGGGKTQLVCETIYRMPDTFTNIIVLCQSAQEPLYQFLKEKLPPEQITFCEGIESLPDLESIEQEDDDHTLVIIDDMVHEKPSAQRKICEYYIRCRKLPASIIYSSQSYFRVPKLIRENCTHIWLRKISGARDLRMILSDYSTGVDNDELWEMYKKCIEDNTFLNIRIIENEMDEKFYKGFLEKLELKSLTDKKEECPTK
jgi:hypothetical protein